MLLGLICVHYLTTIYREFLRIFWALVGHIMHISTQISPIIYVYHILRCAQHSKNSRDTPVCHIRYRFAIQFERSGALSRVRHHGRKYIHIYCIVFKEANKKTKWHAFRRVARKERQIGNRVYAEHLDWSEWAHDVCVCVCVCHSNWRLHDGCKEKHRFRVARFFFVCECSWKGFAQDVAVAAITPTPGINDDDDATKRC